MLTFLTGVVVGAVLCFLALVWLLILESSEPAPEGRSYQQRKGVKRCD